MRAGQSAGSTRRDVLLGSASLTALGLAGLTGVSACAQTRALRSSSADDEDLLDAGLERIASRFPDVRVHRSNHAAMVVEVLCLTGFAARIEPWLSDNQERFDRRAESKRPIKGEAWREALGRDERYTDWQALFLAEIESDGWQPVLRRWVPRLAPGLVGAATHGVIRSAHAARSLGRRDSAPRRFELSIALAYWATTYQELLWNGESKPEKSVKSALARVQTRRPAIAPPRGNIVAGLSALQETPSFAPVAGLVDTSDPARTLSEITAAFARLYLRNPDKRVHFTHAVTAPSALRLLLPSIDEETVEAGVRYAWQAAAGLYVVYGDPRRPEPTSSVPARSAIMKRAAASDRAHCIKLSEACLREEAVSSDPILLAAAWDAATEMNV